jgi:hypothetical protein
VHFGDVQGDPILNSLRRQQQRAYDDVLAQEGLGELDAGGMVSQRGAPTARGSADSVDEYLAWAREVLATCPFALRGHGAPSPATRRQVWAEHAAGRTVTQVAQTLGIARRNVVRAIALTKQEAPPPPVVNPWRKSGRAAVEAKLQEASDMDPKKQERRQVEYSRVILRTEVQVPGVFARKSELVPMKGHRGIKIPLMGTPHAGGIDFELPTEHVLAGSKRKTMTVITVPWAAIQQAEQVPEEVEA